MIGDFLVGELVEVGELEEQAVRNWQMGDDGGHSGGVCGTASPAVGAEFEVGKLAPSDEKGVFENILGWVSATQQMDGDSEQGGLMARRRRWGCFRGFGIRTGE